MSKNFEKEYIALTEIEVPDLWDRIEAGLTPKSAHSPKENEASIIDFMKESVSVKEAESITKEKQRKTQMSVTAEDDVEKIADKKKVPLYFFKKYKTVLAAAVCVIVILPAAVLLGKMGIGMGGAKECAADTAAPETMEYAVTTQAEAEEAPAEIMEESAEAEEAPAEIAKESAVEEALTEIAKESAVEEAEREAVTESAMAEKAEEMFDEVATEAAEVITEYSGEVKRASGCLDVEDGTVLTHVCVHVYGKEEIWEKEEDDGLGNLYRAEVLEDADGLLQRGEEIYIYISSLSSTYWPDEEAVYDVMLEYDSTREYPFSLKACY